jgi:hypothetical protein
MQLEVRFGFDGSGEVVGDGEMTGDDLQTECVLRVGGGDDGRGLGHVDAFVAFEHYYL